MFYPVVDIDKSWALLCPRWAGAASAWQQEFRPCPWVPGRWSGDTGQGRLPVLPGLLICQLKEPLWYGSCPSYKLICGITLKPVGILQFE